MVAFGSTRKPGMDCIAIIPARFDSVRFPGKPLASLAGRPLIHHVVERCREVSLLEQVIVATDDDRIAEAAEAAGAEAVITPADLASGTDRVAWVAERGQARVIVNVQGDEPLIESAGLERAIAAFRESDADFGTLRAALREPEDLWNPNVVKVVVDAAGKALYFSRAPIPFPRACWNAKESAPALLRFHHAPPLPGPYWIHVGVYLYRRHALARWAKLSPSRLERAEGLEQLRVLEAGETIETYEIEESVPGVDTPEDLERVREYLARQ